MLRVECRVWVQWDVGRHGLVDRGIQKVRDVGVYGGSKVGG